MNIDTRKKVALILAGFVFCTTFFIGCNKANKISSTIKVTSSEKTVTESQATTIGTTLNETQSLAQSTTVLSTSVKISNTISSKNNATTTTTTAQKVVKEITLAEYLKRPQLNDVGRQEYDGYYYFGFCYSSFRDANLYRLKTDGTGTIEKMLDHEDLVSQAYALNGFVYCLANEKIIRVGTDKKNYKVLDSKERYVEIAVAGKWIFGRTWDNTIYRISLDGSVKKRVAFDEKSGKGNVAIFFGFDRGYFYCTFSEGTSMGYTSHYAAIDCRSSNPIVFSTPHFMPCYGTSKIVDDGAYFNSNYTYLNISTGKTTKLLNCDSSITAIGSNNYFLHGDTTYNPNLKTYHLINRLTGKEVNTYTAFGENIYIDCDYKADSFYIRDTTSKNLNGEKTIRIIRIAGTQTKVIFMTTDK